MTLRTALLERNEQLVILLWVIDMTSAAGEFLLRLDEMFSRVRRVIERQLGCGDLGPSIEFRMPRCETVKRSRMTRLALRIGERRQTG